MVLGVKRQHLLVQTVRRLEVRKPEDLPVELEAVTQDVQRAFDVELFHQGPDDERLQSGRVQRAHLGPEPGLRRFQEREHPRREKRTLDIPLGVSAGLPTTLPMQHVLDVSSKARSLV